MSIPGRTQGEARQRAKRSFAQRELLLPAQSFVHTETVSAGVLLLAALAALAWANSPWSASYHHFWEETYLGFDLGFLGVRESLRHWVNDGLMVIFFFVVGLEVRHEMDCGELSSLRRAGLPVIAALGGMALPAATYAAFNWGGENLAGWGVPMATDIAFALGVVAVAGDRLPFQARVFLLALAAVDDIGAILAIAIFYSSDISVTALLVAAVLLGGMFGMRALGVRNVAFYWIAGVAVWLAVFESGVHATIAGVVLGLITPSRPFTPLEEFSAAMHELTPRFDQALEEGRTEEAEVVLGHVEALTTETEAPLDRRLRQTHPWSAFLILPLFALANAGVEISGAAVAAAAASAVTWGIVAGLILGKTVGIFGASFLAVRSGVADLPADVTWLQVLGLALTAGVGFTVALFISELAFSEEGTAAEAKIAILVASATAGVGGLLLLRAGGRAAKQ